MTDQAPIDRAAQAIESTLLTGNRRLTPEQARDAARESFESIDTDQLARVFHPGYGQDGFTPENCAPCKEALDTAHAVKAWLTGKETQ